jgi:Flp pilus assembly protein TadB
VANKEQDKMSDDDNKLHAVWQQREGDPMQFSVEDLKRQARSFARSIRWRNVREYAAAAVVVLLFSCQAVRAITSAERWGSCLVVAAAVFVCGYLRSRGRAPELDSSVETRTMLASHRRELERQRDLLRSVGRWYLLPFVPGFVMLLIGRTAEHPVAAVAGAVVAAAVFAVVLWLNRAAAHGLQRDIEALRDPDPSGVTPPG